MCLHKIQVIVGLIQRWWNQRGLQVVGSDYYGWSAKFAHDHTWMWASSRETAINEATKRRRL